MKKSKLYTKSGDKGESGLFGGARVSKTHQRLKAYGTLDEVSAVLGIVLSFEVDDALTRPLLSKIQSELLTIGCHLASVNKVPGVRDITEEDITHMEKIIDSLDEKLPELKNFILLGGGAAGSHLHLARTICRRAERETVQLSAQEAIDPYIVKYLNRLSDLLFILARYENDRIGKKEEIWSSKPC
ncbi:MAG: cob(I)yrinic acid a,c-diamide adenosyltransferase [Patescibacteria group bacterium]